VLEVVLISTLRLGLCSALLRRYSAFAVCPQAIVQPPSRRYGRLRIATYLIRLSADAADRGRTFNEFLARRYEAFHQQIIVLALQVRPRSRRIVPLAIAQEFALRFLDGIEKMRDLVLYAGRRSAACVCGTETELSGAESRENPDLELY
jgi:hypothetical protein